MRNMVKNKVSVIIPIYNAEEYLEECIESVLSQTYKNYEIILINDGSEDNSKEISLKYSKKFKNIFFIDQENKGIAETRNIGIENSDGEYIFFLDSDDKIDENLLKICVETLENNHLDIVHFGYETLQDGQIVKKSKLFESHRILSGKEFFKISARYNAGQNFEGCTYMYRREFWEKNNLFFKKGLVFEDAEIYIQVLLSDVKMMVINEHFYVYRMSENSIMRTQSYTYNYLESINNLINTYKNKIIQNRELENEIKKFIKIHLIVKFKVLLKLDNLTEDILKRELYSILDLSEELSIGIEDLYIEKLKRKAEKLKLSTSIFHEKKVKNVLEYGQVVRYEKIKNMEFEDENKVIGIYGIGKHTKGILNYYEEKIGKIRAEVILIDSNLHESFSHEYNLKIINVEDIRQYNFNKIVISAPYSEEEIYLKLIETGYKKDIYRLYENNDIVLFV